MTRLAIEFTIEMRQQYLLTRPKGRGGHPVTLSIELR
jgi:hypothetical protein